tara:strand:+ start:2824 stop:4629 length:1806 start_codon:yes stop_codon:yes gene_type:complete
MVGLGLGLSKLGGVFNSVVAQGRSLATLVQDNLQLWLDFTKSEIVGGEEVVNGDFSDGINDWTLGANWTLGVDKLTSSGSGLLQQDTTHLINGRTYETSFEIKDYTSGGVKLYSGNGSDTPSYQSSLGTHYDTFVANGATTSIYSNNFVGTITNISIKEVSQFIEDKSPNTNNAKLFTGKAMSFDGVNDKVETPQVTLTGDFTLAFTFMVLDNWENVIISEAGSWNNNVQVRKATSLIHFRNYVDFTFTAMNTNTYYRAVITRTNGLVECYLDNTKSSVTVTKTDSVTWSVIGVHNSSSNPFYGNLADIQIFDTAWDSDDVAFDYNNPNKLVTDSANTGTSLVVADLKGYWALSEGAGSIAYDSSGQGNNGTIIGATYVDKQDSIPQLGMMDWAKSTPVADEITLIQAPNTVGFDILGNALRLRENAFNLDGSGYAEIPDDGSLDFGAGAFSIDGWTKFKFINSGSSSGNCIYSNGSNTSSASTFSIATDRATGSTDGVINFYIDTSSVVNHAFEIADGTWFYFAGTRDSSGNVKLYINNAEVDSGVSTGNVTNTDPKYIGRDGGTLRHYKELISGVRVYNRELTATEITNNYNVGLAAHS